MQAPLTLFQVDYLLSTVDNTIQTGKSNVASGLAGVRELHENNMKVATAAAHSYFEYIHKIADWASDKLNPVRGGQAVSVCVCAWLLVLWGWGFEGRAVREGTLGGALG